MIKLLIPFFYIYLFLSVLPFASFALYLIIYDIFVKLQLEIWLTTRLTSIFFPPLSSYQLYSRNILVFFFWILIWEFVKKNTCHSSELNATAYCLPFFFSSRWKILKTLLCAQYRNKIGHCYRNDIIFES